MQSATARIFCASFLILFLMACQNFYKTVSAPAVSLEDKENSIKENLSMRKYFILQQGGRSYAMSNIEVDQQAQVLSFKLSALPPEHTLYTTPGQQKVAKRYKKNQPEKAVLTEVHLFTNMATKLDTLSTVRLPLSNLEKIEVIEHDKGRTSTSYVLGGIGIGLATVAVALVIVALTKSSCPFVSVYDGEKYDVQAELFGGAIYPSLERKDYVPLRISPVNGQYTIRITNELQEKQFTNFARLMVVTHNKGEEVLTDAEGNVHAFGRLQAPRLALLNEKKDITAAVEKQDALFCNFDERTENHLNTVTLQFEKPAAQKNARLVLELKNSYWFDFLYGEFTQAFGSYYNKWVKQQKKTPVAELEQWSQEQHIPMNISIKTKTGWKPVRSLKTIGPLTNRKVLIPLDLSEIAGDRVELQLTTGFMFWELDAAGIDYSGGSQYQVALLDPAVATDENGVDVRASLLQDDSHYLDQPHPGNIATLHYKWDKALPEGKENTVILFTKGYYEHVRNYTGKPRLSFLKNFRNPGAFAGFSQQQFEQVSRAQANNQ